MISVILPDKELIEGFLAGDQTSGNELALRYYPRVLSVCFQYLRTAEAHDAAQEVFFKVLAQRKIGTFRGQAKLWTWLYRVTVNICYRYLTARLAYSAKSLLLDEPSWLEACLPARDHDPEEINLLRMQLERMVKAIYRLRGSYREPLILVCLRGYTYAEAAAELGVTPRALGVRLTRAKKRLAEMMNNHRPRRAAGESPGGLCISENYTNTLRSDNGF